VSKLLTHDIEPLPRIRFVRAGATFNLPLEFIQDGAGKQPTDSADPLAEEKAQHRDSAAISNQRGETGSGLIDDSLTTGSRLPLIIEQLNRRGKTECEYEEEQKPDASLVVWLFTGTIPRA
jgi:hypothetical protein